MTNCKELHNKQYIERLSQFEFNRSNIKKVIMTIPYNAKLLSLVQYVKDSLFPVENNELLRPEEIIFKLVGKKHNSIQVK